jgi:hypothetical protein
MGSVLLLVRKQIYTKILKYVLSFSKALCQVVKTRALKKNKKEDENRKLKVKYEEDYSKKKGGEEVI